MTTTPPTTTSDWTCCDGGKNVATGTTATPTTLDSTSKCQSCNTGATHCFYLHWGWWLGIIIAIIAILVLWYVLSQRKKKDQERKNMPSMRYTPGGEDGTISGL